MPIDSSNRPRYQVLADILREQIAAGVFSPASRLPSESQLTQQFQVSRITVRSALAMLIDEGLVHTRQGRGNFVRPVNRQPSRTEPRGVRHEAGRYRDNSVASGMILVKEPASSCSNATRGLALELGCDEHAPLFIHDRLLIDAGNWRLSHRLYLPQATCDEIEELKTNPFREPDDLYAILAGAGHKLRWVETVTARTPARDDATTLGIPKGIPMLVIHRLTKDARAGHVLAMEETRTTAEDTQLAFHL